MYVNFEFDSNKTMQCRKVVEFAIGEVFRQYIGTAGKADWTLFDLQNIEKANRLFASVKGFIDNMLIDRDNAEGIWKNISEEAYYNLDNLISSPDSMSKIYFDTIQNIGNSSLGKDVPDVNENNNTAISKKAMENNETYEECIAKNILHIFKFIPKASYNLDLNKSQLILDKDGLPEMVNSKKLWKLLEEKLEGEQHFKKFKETLLSEKIREIIPEIEFINEMLKTSKDDVEKSPSELKQFLEFYRTFSKSKTTCIKDILVPYRRQGNGIDNSVFNKESSYIEDIKHQHDLQELNLLKYKEHIDINDYKSRTTIKVVEKRIESHHSSTNSSTVKERKIANSIASIISLILFIITAMYLAYIALVSIIIPFLLNAISFIYFSIIVIAIFLFILFLAMLYRGINK